MTMPTPLSDENLAKILDLITAGMPTHKALKACKVQSGDFYRRIAANEADSTRYVRAKEHQLQALADEIVELADTAKKAKKVKHTPEGTTTEWGDNVQRTHLQIESRKWLLAKLKPKVYGDRLDVNATGGPLVIIKDQTGKPDL